MVEWHFCRWTCNRWNEIKSNRIDGREKEKIKWLLNEQFSICLSINWSNLDSMNEKRLKTAVKNGNWRWAQVGNAGRKKRWTFLLLKLNQFNPSTQDICYGFISLCQDLFFYPFSRHLTFVFSDSPSSFLRWILFWFDFSFDRMKSSVSVTAHQKSEMERKCNEHYDSIGFVIARIEPDWISRFRFKKSHVKIIHF